MLIREKWLKTSFFWLLTLLVIVGITIFVFVSYQPATTRAVPISTLMGDLKVDIAHRQLDTLTVSDGNVTLVRGQVLHAQREEATIDETFDITRVLKDSNIDYTNGTVVKLTYQNPGPIPGWLAIFGTYAPLFLTAFLFVLLLRLLSHNLLPGISFGRGSKKVFQGRKQAITFSNVAGIEEAKQSAQEAIDFLRHPDRFSLLGAQVPKGLLLMGPPGAGKTLLAHAIAGEANVPLFSIHGSEFIETFGSAGANRIRDLFAQAKRHHPCILFMDEIDAIGRLRGVELSGLHHDEREQTLNQILTEMDSLDTTTSMIVVAATNRPDILDPALLRPGRFDRQVTLGKPDVRERSAIFAVHALGKPLDDNVSLELLAKQTPGFTGADIANLLNEAAILAGRRDKEYLGMKELEEAVEKIVAGPGQRSRIISEREKSITAYHEIGHALVARMLRNTDPVHKVSIVAHGQSGGFTMLLPTEDRYLWSKLQFDDMLAYALGGHVAESLIFGEVTTGSSNDIQWATRIAHSMVTEYGMSRKIGPLALGHKDELLSLTHEGGEQRNYSETTAREVDEEVRRIMLEAFDKAYTILNENKSRLIMISERLIKEETLEGPQFEALFNESLHDDPDKETSIEVDLSKKLGNTHNMVRSNVTYPLPPQLQTSYRSQTRNMTSRMPKGIPGL